MILPRSFYQRDAITVARALLGQRLVRTINHKRIAGIIVETEAYLGTIDRAAHTFNGRRTPRNQSMWGNGGHTYVYFTYGMHYCMNAVAGRIDQPIAVLIRALEPTDGIDTMFTHRNTGKNHARHITDLCAGPARLCQAMKIDRQLDGNDLTQPQHLCIERIRQRALPNSKIATSPRIGVAYANEWAQKPLRFYIRNNPHLSR